ncbi:MAG: DeoR/GlpR transcriptional regulator [Alphaproteobacteria bacterium HGW-Alphaproteobacteria-6]|nr:MAG: DeoR/GlpR transcriptional regulator [Alphaproteobacteria bacterium HGW-Alphaproteobacteria-6]
MLSRRHADILRILDAEGPVTIAALARRLAVSLETVRRDLRPLSATGRVLRTHGAVGLTGQIGEAPFLKRMRENAAAKQAIARALAATIRDGDAVMFDTGTTTSFAARELIGHRRLTVVTNSSDIARTLAGVNGNRVYMAGGELRPDSGAAFGKSALDFIARFSVRHAVISAGAVDEGGVMDHDLEEAEFARLVLECGERRVVVTDAAKFGRRGLTAVAGWDRIDTVITDRAPADRIGAAIAAGGGTLQIAAPRDAITAAPLARG